MKKGLLSLSAVVALSCAVPTHAALTPGTPGLINDTTLNITWLQDANLVKTSCDANNALWQAFDPSALPAPEQSGNTKSDICNTLNGRLNWYEAEAWIAVLNAQSYLGYNDWRQPTTGPINGSIFNYSFGYDGTFDYGYNVSAPGTPHAGSTGSELAHLFFNSLGNSAYSNTAGVDQSATYCTGPNACLQNTGPFSNMQSYVYWSGTEYAPVPSGAWFFNTFNGYQSLVFKDYDDLFVWPVRGGQSAAAPSTAQPVPALGGFGLAALGVLLAGLAGRRIRLFG